MVSENLSTYLPRGRENTSLPRIMRPLESFHSTFKRVFADERNRGSAAMEAGKQLAVHQPTNREVAMTVPTHVRAKSQTTGYQSCPGGTFFDAMPSLLPFSISSPELWALSKQQDTAGEEVIALQAQLAASQTQNAKAAKQHARELAHKNELVSEVLSRYQALCASHEDLQVLSKQQATQLADKDKSVCRAKSDNRTLQNAVEAQGQNLSSAVRRIDLLEDAITTAARVIHEQEAQLSTTAARATALENQLTSTQQTVSEQEGELWNAFQESQAADAKLRVADNTISHLEAKVEELEKAKSKATKELIQAKSEWEKTTFQTMRFRQAMDQDPGKTAEMDNAIALLKKDLEEAEERAIQAEEECIQLQKRKDLEDLENKAETTALAAENRMVSAALNGELTNNRICRQAVDSFLGQTKEGITDGSLNAALEMYCSVAHRNKRLDAKIVEMTQMHSEVAQKAKSLLVDCHKLEITAQETETKISDLETELRQKGDKVDTLEIEGDAKRGEYEASLKRKDAEIETAKREAAHHFNILSIMKDASAEACTSWWFEYQEEEVEKARAALQKAEQHAEDLAQELYAMKEYQEMEKNYRDWHDQDYSEFPELLATAQDKVQDLERKISLYETSQQTGEAIPYSEMLAASQEEVKDLQKRLEESECKYASPDYVKFSDHMARINEVQTQATTQMETEVRQHIEAEVEKDVTSRFGMDFVLPLIQLGGHFWSRIGRLERVLRQQGHDMDDNNRTALLRASREFQIDTTGGIPHNL